MSDTPWKDEAEKALAIMRNNVEEGRNLTALSQGVESQRWSIWAKHSQPVTCPGCGEAVSYFQAGGHSEEAYSPNDRPYKFECPHCESELLYVVPFMSLDVGWQWELAIWPATGKRKEGY